MGTAPRYIPHYTLEDFNRWQGEWELIDGVPISRSPASFGQHERIIARLMGRISHSIESQGCPCEIYTNINWFVSDDTVVRPDLMVVCGEQPRQHLERPPTIAVEVTSDSTRARDLTAKRTLYREQDVSHYLVVDPKDQTIQHITSSGSVSVDCSKRLLLALGSGHEIQFQLDELFD